MHIDPALHEQFVREFGLNMVNTLTARDNRLIAHRRRIHIFDERGGVMGAEPDGPEPGDVVLREYQNLTTGVFHSRSRRIVGVRYRCVPNTLRARAIGAFHTHPALYDRSVERMRRRIDQMLWLSEMDLKAFYKQHELYGYEWHFIGCVDIGCFNIHDLKAERFHPRYVLRYPALEGLLETLGPRIEHYDRILSSAGESGRRPSSAVFAEILESLTHRAGRLPEVLAGHTPGSAGELAAQLATECQLRGFSARHVRHWVERHVPESEEPAFLSAEAPPVLAFKRELLSAYDRLSLLV